MPGDLEQQGLRLPHPPPMRRNGNWPDRSVSWPSAALSPHADEVINIFAFVTN